MNSRAVDARGRWRILPLGLLLLLVWGSEAGHAQESSSVLHLDVTLVVGRDGSVEVEERIQLPPMEAEPPKASSRQLHRPLPLQRPSLFGGSTRRIRWEGVKVTGPGGEAQRWQLRGRSGGQAILTALSPPDEVTLAYVGHGLVERQGQTAGLRWSLVPWMWERNIQSVNVWLALPLGVTGV